MLVAGAVYAWGWNRDGQLGVGDDRDRAEPTLVEADSLAADIIKVLQCGQLLHTHPSCELEDAPNTYTFSSGRCRLAPQRCAGGERPGLHLGRQQVWSARQRNNNHFMCANAGWRVA